MLISHKTRLLQLYRICAKYRLDTHLPLDDMPELAPLARLIRLHPASFGKSHEPLGIKYALEDGNAVFKAGATAFYSLRPFAT